MTLSDCPTCTESRKDSDLRFHLLLRVLPTLISRYSTPEPNSLTLNVEVPLEDHFRLRKADSSTLKLPEGSICYVKVLEIRRMADSLRAARSRTRM